MLRFILIAVLILASLGTALAQRKWGFGVKTGLTFSQFDGPSESANGMSFEEYSSESGFHVGLLVRYRLAKQLGLQSGFAYNQKGTSYEYDGDSYFIFPRGISEPFYGVGRREESVNTTNSYLQIPLEFYYKINKIVEVHAGVYGALLVGSTSTGSLIFDGVSAETEQEIQRFRVGLGYAYLQDEAGQGKSLQNRTVTVDGVDVFLPRSIGAYFFLEEVEKNYLRSWDAGLTGGLSFYLNRSLFLNVSAFYGFSDVTRQEVDYSRLSLDENNDLIFLDDKDRNLSIQAAIGFVF